MTGDMIVGWGEGLLSSGVLIALITYFGNKKRENANTKKTGAEEQFINAQTYTELMTASKVRDGLKDGLIEQWKNVAEGIGKHWAETLKRLDQVEEDLQGEIQMREQCVKRLDELEKKVNRR